MDSSYFLTRQYLKLLQAMVYISNKGLSTRPVQYLLGSNTAERKIISEGSEGPIVEIIKKSTSATKPAETPEYFESQEPTETTEAEETGE